MQTGNQKNLTNREDRAQALLLGGAVEHLIGNFYRVFGSKVYTVILGGEPTCTCEDHRRRSEFGVVCKHIRACELFRENMTQAHTIREMVVA